jgi:hypothetical protein
VDAEAAGRVARQRVMEVSRREETKRQAAQVHPFHHDGCLCKTQYKQCKRTV